MRVLVCGGRDFTDGRRVFAVLAALHVERGIDLLIQGGARGADRIAKAWADKSRVSWAQYDADWERDGRRAGHIRNQRMLDEGKPDLVVAFPGGRDTADMVSRAQWAGVEVYEVPEA